MILITNTKERERFFRFAIVGALGAVVDFGIFNLLTQFVQIKAVVASVISFICAVISNFLWNRYWTYSDSRSKSITRQMTQFFLINVVGLIIRTPLFACLEKVFINLFNDVTIMGFISPLIIAHNLSLAIAIVVVMLWNFFANRYWTYSDVSS